MADKNVDVDKRNEDVEKKHDSSRVASTFIKYAAYLIIFFGILWFLINYILPQF
ncbi:MULTISPECIES: hypothetical protein [Alteribacter]|uniref:hypothetical protein n=1 Tax=Alteribacter TaxID=2823237 RepID=UPI001606EAA8|nr:hypothetical protein [Alteribacter keqinensis]MBM7097687.1 hypothetical protein [Alteribacter salitolerans]